MKHTLLLSGEGADEELGGYLYFHKAPNPTEFHEECVRKLQDLYKYDCLVSILCGCVCEWVQVHVNE